MSILSQVEQNLRDQRAGKVVKMTWGRVIGGFLIPVIEGFLYALGAWLLIWLLGKPW